MALELPHILKKKLDGLPRDLRRVSKTARALEGIGSDLFIAWARDAVQKVLSPKAKLPLDGRIETDHGEKIVVWLVHPTNYRENGIPRKWKKQILPTNAIGQLWGLMPRSINENEQEIPVELHFLEDTAQPFDIDAIRRSMDGDGVKGVLMLCGVQTNQWPRAKDLASLCKEHGIPVVAGGYHIRADLPVTEKEAGDLGMALAIGEAESLIDGKPFLETILRDVLNGNLKPNYRQTENPGIENERLSTIIPDYQKLMITPSMATMETSRGCPQPCSFCTIRTIGGTKVRARTPENMKDWLREIYEQQGIRDIFITDDNFSKSNQRFEILEMLSGLRAEGFPFGIMIQVDTTATWGKEGARFVEACKKAGVYAVFLGIESVDPHVLQDMNKPQNHPERYKAMIDAWHHANILAQCGFIIGNRQETKGVGKRSAEQLIEMGIDVAAAYVLTPLPGSVDYHIFHQTGVVKERDFNSYDSHSEACLEFPGGGLSRKEVMEEYKAFFDEFFAWRNVLRLSERLQGATLKSAIRQWLWYKFASSKGDHPMYSGIGAMSPDFTRADFGNNHLPASAVDLAPRPTGPGAPMHEKRRLAVL